MLVMSATNANPTKPQIIIFKEEPGLLVATLLIKAIKAALLPPLRNPVAIAIAIIFQEERSRKEIKCMIFVYKPI
jgi:hypothetical protein